MTETPEERALLRNLSNKHGEWMQSEYWDARRGLGVLLDALEATEQHVDAAEADRDVLADALRNQGLLQNTATGVVWHAHDCAASFDFAECNYRCRVAREAFALVGTEPYVSAWIRREKDGRDA